MIRDYPKLQDTVAGWMRFGYTKAQALRELIAWHMKLHEARGRGAKAMLRVSIIELRCESQEWLIDQRMDAANRDC